MAKKNYYGVKVGKNIGVYDTWGEASEQVTGFKGAVFKGFATKIEAYRYVGLPIVEDRPKVIMKPIINKGNNKPNRDRDFIAEYRKKNTDKSKLIYVSSLSDEDKNLLYSKMSKSEIAYYKRIASDLMEKRYSAVKRDKEVLDYLTIDPKIVSCDVLNSKYKKVDLSITIYTIKAIINVMGESNFSKDDGSSYFNKNATTYYYICKKYWNSIWWDTDTGVLSKEEIEQRKFSTYHKNCNKIETISEILKMLQDLRINNFEERYDIISLKAKYTKHLKKIELRKKEEEELLKKKKFFYKTLDDKYLFGNFHFDNIAKNLKYDIEKINLMKYRLVAIDKSIVEELNENDILDFKKKALYTIENHFHCDYSREFIIEAVNVLKNLIL